MSTITCPICKTAYEENQACPICSFEQHSSPFEGMTERFKELEENRITQHQNWWNDQQEQIAKLNASITEKNQQIVGLNNTIDEKNQTITDLNLSIETKNQEIERLITSTAEKDLEIERQNALVAKKDQEIDELSTKIAEKDREIERLKQKAPICYLVHKEKDQIRDIHPVFKGETMVGKNPQSGEQFCRVITSCKELQNEHFKIIEHDDGNVVAISVFPLGIGTQFDIVNPGEERELDNATIIYVGEIQLIVILQ